MPIARSIFAAGGRNSWGDILSFAWDANPGGEGVTGYNLYRRPPGGALTFFLALGNVTSAKVASPGQWYYAITALNAIGSESAISNELLDAAG